MDNLAGRDYAADTMEKELVAAGIPVVEGNNHDPEVIAAIHGKLGNFQFHRHWYYWGVSGPVPLEVARELYANPTGKNDVRVAGHCGCPPPEEWARNGFVHSYHIDSQAGLNLFVDTIRKHGLA